MRYAFVFVLALTAASSAEKVDATQDAKHQQGESDNAFANARKGFASWTDQAAKDVKHEFDKFDFKPAEKWLAQAGENIQSWTGQAATEVRHELDKVDLGDAAKWLAQAGHDVQTWSGQAAADVKHEFDKINLSEVDKWLAKAGVETHVKETWEGVRAVRLEDVPEHLLRFIRENPGQTTFVVVNGVVFFAPGIVVSPLLYLLGFRDVGVAASSMAAFWQSAVAHPIARRGIFAYLTSAGMKGYGTGTVNMASRGVLAAVHVADQVFRRAREDRGHEDMAERSSREKSDQQGESHAESDGRNEQHDEL